MKLETAIIARMNQHVSSSQDLGKWSDITARFMRRRTVMGDTISRLAAIDAFAPYAEYESNRTNAEWVRRINRVLLELPPAQPKWIPCSERLPEENVYVLVWCGEVKIARIICGISKEQRIKMQEEAIDDPVSWAWNLSKGYFKVKRSESYRPWDEYGNNKVPYCWDCIHGRMFGQDVKYWMPLPCRPEGEQNDTTESQ